MSGSSSDRVVDIVSRHAQWRIDDLGSFTHRKTNTFKLGLWNWNLFVEKPWTLIVKLSPEKTPFTRDFPPIASFVIRVVSFAGGCRKTFNHPRVTDKLFKWGDHFFWEVDAPLRGSLVIDVEFLDLATASPTCQHGDLRHVMQIDRPLSVWATEPAQKSSHESSLSMLAKMLQEGIHTDIIIKASDGSIGAHRAVLASASPVFRSMFSYELKEKDLSVIDIPDMSIEACEAFLNYIYGSFQQGDFLTHRVALLHAADKYDISDLKETCQESLLDDINSGNALERLEYASLYKVPKLKVGCMTYLVKFGKIFDIRDQFTSFLHTADVELVAEIFNEVLNAWRES